MSNPVLLAEAVGVTASGSSILKGILTGKDLLFLMNKSYGLGFTTSLLMECLRCKIICHAIIKRNGDVIISMFIITLALLWYYFSITLVFFSFTLVLLKFILLKHTNFFKLGKYKFNIPIYTPGNVFLKIKTLEQRDAHNLFTDFWSCKKS